MQILPGTWEWIQLVLAPGRRCRRTRPRTTSGAASLLLHSLLGATGGDPATAAAGYYQGLPSVQAHGMYSDTQQYVKT